MPDRMSNRMSEDMSDRMPEDLPVRKCINVMVGITRSKVIKIKYVFLAICHHIFQHTGFLGKNEQKTSFVSFHKSELSTFFFTYVSFATSTYNEI